jgi:hypothetical protein
MGEECALRLAFAVALMDGVELTAASPRARMTATTTASALPRVCARATLVGVATNVPWRFVHPTALDTAHAPRRASAHANKVGVDMIALSRSVSTIVTDMAHALHRANAHASMAGVAAFVSVRTRTLTRWTLFAAAACGALAMAAAHKKVANASTAGRACTVTVQSVQGTAQIMVNV